MKMVLSESQDDELYRMHQDLCSKLNLDPNIASTSWETYQSLCKKFVMEGDKIHWLGCSIYAASREIETPSLDTSTIVKGSGINLTSLLRHSNLSFVQFFTNILRWIEMAQLPDDFRHNITDLRDAFGIAYTTFKEYHPLFSKIFISPVPNALDVEASKHKNRRMRPVPCTSLKIFEFIWNMFILMKAEEPSCGTELIKSHHLLYCCIDLAFKNAISSERKDLLNPKSAQELSTDNSDYPALTEVPCIVKKFVKCQSVTKEALHMKVYTFRPLVNKLIQMKVLIADESDLTGIFDSENFDQNFRNITKEYETHLLSHGDFDERIFLAEYKRVLMEKEQTTPNWTNIKVLPSVDSSDILAAESPQKGVEVLTTKGLDTPLTGRRFLGPRDDMPDKSTSEKISRLHALINNRSAAPGIVLKQIFDSCENDPLPKVFDTLALMKDKFIKAYTANGYWMEEAQNRAEVAITLFYKYVELILQKEETISSDISMLVEKDIFYKCMFACCLEMVLYCYNFTKKFPWLLDILGLEPIHFVKVIELTVRSTKDHLFRELIKHLNRIEEMTIESLIWKGSSPIWDALENSSQSIPKFQDTALPGHLLYNDGGNDHILQSPGGPSASDCFQSPLSQVSRNLFPSGGQRHTHIMISGKDGNLKLIPIMDNERQRENQQSPGARPDPQAAALPRRTGSLSIIFRKFYNLAGVRMQHLCSNLGFTDFDLKRKIWTIFEDSIRHTDLIKDRHLDQLLMCAIYVICKACNVSNFQNLFTIIMKFYRQQPQASSSVYRDVLIERKKVQVDGEIIPEKRDDLIQFYNSVYVKVMQTYAIRFQPNTNPNNNIVLSPLPLSKKHLVSPNQQIVGNVFVKPLESASSQTGSTYNYYFSRSPSKDLKNINRAINNNGVQGKRLLTDEEDLIPSKRIANRKIQSLVEERRIQNAE